MRLIGLTLCVIAILMTLLGVSSGWGRQACILVVVGLTSIAAHTMLVRDIPEECLVRYRSVGMARCKAILKDLTRAFLRHSSAVCLHTRTLRKETSTKRHDWPSRDRPAREHRLLRSVASEQVYYGRYLFLTSVKIAGYRVLKAIDIWTGQTVAIKQVLLAPSGTNIPSYILAECLRHEAWLLSVLPAGCGPRLIEFIEEGALLVLIMEWIDGKTLAEVIEEKQLTVQGRINVAMQVCNAIARLHHCSPPLLHNDLKPSNLIVTPDGQVIPIDFGLSRYVGETPFLNERMGTVPYTSPEQWRGEALDVRSDIYSLGVLLGELLPHAELPQIAHNLSSAVGLERADRPSSVKVLYKELDTMLHQRISNSV